MIEERDYHHNGKVFELVQQKDCAQCAFFVAKNEPCKAPVGAPHCTDHGARQASAFRPGKDSAKPVRASLGATDQSAAVAQEYQPCELFPIARA